MSYPHIEIKFDQFDEFFEVNRMKSAGVYQEIAKFKEREDAYIFAWKRASKEVLPLVDLCN